MNILTNFNNYIQNPLFWIPQSFLPIAKSVTFLSENVCSLQRYSSIIDSSWFIYNSKNDGFDIFFVLDYGIYFRYLSSRIINKANTTKEYLYERAIYNLDDFVAKIIPIAESGDIIKVIARRKYESCFVLDTFRWRYPNKKYSHRKKGNYIFAIPTRDVLLYTYSKKKNIKLLHEKAVKIYNSQNNRITTDVFELVDGKLFKYEF